MKVLLVHARYYEAGGPERYLFTVKKILEEHGHEVVPFSVKSRHNVPSAYERYFAEPLNENDSFYFDDLRRSPRAMLTLLGRQFYSKHAHERLTRLIDDVKPDVAYLLQFHKRLSSSVLDACRSRKVPVVVRLSDYWLQCPKNIFFRDGAVCELCVDGLSHCVKHRCIRGSLAASMVGAGAMEFNYRRGFQKMFAHVVCPSAFMEGKLTSDPRFAGISVSHIPTPVDLSSWTVRGTVSPDPSFAYWGRFADDKGIDVLIRAARLLTEKGRVVKVKMMGGSSEDELAYVRRMVEQHHAENVDVLPFVTKERIIQEAQGALAAIVPSIWYDNMPNALLESFAMGIPVIASRIGSLADLVTHEKTGLLFEPGDAQALSLSMERLVNAPDRSAEWGTEARAWLEKECAPDVHYRRLISIFERVHADH